MTTCPPIPPTLIEKLQSLKVRPQGYTSDNAWRLTLNNTVDSCIRIVREHQLIEGEWHSADSSLKGTAKSIPCESEAPASGKASEIRDNEMLHTLNALSNENRKRDGTGLLSPLEVLSVVRPYLRATKPVSLAHCTKVCMEADYKAFQNTNYARKYDQRTLGERYAEVTKAVLDAAGVTYGD